MAGFTREDIKKDTHEIVDAAMTQMIDQISEVIHDWMRIMEERFSRVDGRLISIEKQNDRFLDRMDAERERLDNHGGRIVTLEKKVGLKT